MRKGKKGRGRRGKGKGERKGKGGKGEGKGGGKEGEGNVQTHSNNRATNRHIKQSGIHSLLHASTHSSPTCRAKLGGEIFFF